MISKKKVLAFFYRMLICIIILLIVLIGIKTSPKFKTEIYKNVFETNISFSQINAIYEKYAGSSLPFKDYFIKETKTVFNENLNYKEKSKYLDGVKLIVDINYLVPSLEDGLVIFTGNKEGYGNTIIIGQSNGIDVWYCNIENFAIELYDNVKKGQLIGNVSNDYFYLVFKKDGAVLNYEDYLQN